MLMYRYQHNSNREKLQYTNNFTNRNIGTCPLTKLFSNFGFVQDLNQKHLLVLKTVVLILKEHVPIYISTVFVS